MYSILTMATITMVTLRSYIVHICNCWSSEGQNFDVFTNIEIFCIVMWQGAKMRKCLDNHHVNCWFHA